MKTSSSIARIVGIALFSLILGALWGGVASAALLFIAGLVFSISATLSMWFYAIAVTLTVGAFAFIFSRKYPTGHIGGFYNLPNIEDGKEMDGRERKLK